MKIADLKKNISESIYKQVLDVNEIDENCTLLREAIERDEAQCKDIKLKNCWIQNEILYKDSQLWVSFNELLQMNLIREMHDQFSIDHLDILRMIKIIKRNYYWSFMQKTVDRYIQNCYVCQWLLRAYQDWLELVNDLVEIWSRSDSDLTQIWLNTFFLSQHSFLSSTSCLSTSSSFHVTNTFLSSLAQSLNIT